MNEVTLNGELSLSYPDGFHVMDAEEQRRVFFEDAPDRWGIWDTGRHVIVTLTWHSSNGFLAKLSNPKDQAKRVEAKARKAYKSAGYKLLGFSDARLAGKEACAVSFEYAIQGVEQVADVLVFRNGATYYFTYFYARKDDVEASRKVLDEVLASYRLT